MEDSQVQKMLAVTNTPIEEIQQKEANPVEIEVYPLVVIGLDLDKDEESGSDEEIERPGHSVGHAVVADKRFAFGESIGFIRPDLGVAVTKRIERYIGMQVRVSEVHVSRVLASYCRRIGCYVLSDDCR